MENNLIKGIDSCFNDIALCDEVKEVRNRILHYLKNNVVEVDENSFKLKTPDTDRQVVVTYI